MLTITVPSRDLWDSGKEEFIPVKGRTLQLEHSLISLSKWESRWCKPFLVEGEKTEEETIDYIRCMTVTPAVDPNIYLCLTSQNYQDIQAYIKAPMTATTFPKEPGSTSREIATSELIYYWMLVHSIPFECQKWHINRLLTLIRVCNIKKQPARKMSMNEIIARNSALNAERKVKLNTTG